MVESGKIVKIFLFRKCFFDFFLKKKWPYVIFLITLRLFFRAKNVYLNLREQENYHSSSFFARTGHFWIFFFFLELKKTSNRLTSRQKSCVMQSLPLSTASMTKREASNPAQVTSVSLVASLKLKNGNSAELVNFRKYSESISLELESVQKSSDSPTTES